MRTYLWLPCARTGRTSTLTRHLELCLLLSLKCLVLHLSSIHIGSIMATKTVSLTTTFTPASSCFASTFTVGPKYRDTLTRGYGNNAIVRGVDPVCYPNNFYGIDSIVSGTTVAPFYSPGICPSGWTTATTTVPAGATVTTATCCPSYVEGPISLSKHIGLLTIR